MELGAADGLCTNNLRPPTLIESWKAEVGNHVVEVAGVDDGGRREGAFRYQLLSNPVDVIVADAYDAFGNKVSGTSVRVHAPPGGKSSITF